MAGYRDLPDEVLHLIFANLDRKDVLNCQYTCRNWHVPAHVWILGEVELNGPDHVRSFINSIDQNPNLLYLNAVKSLKINKFGNKIKQTRKQREEERYALLKEFFGIVDEEYSDEYEEEYDEEDTEEEFEEEYEEEYEDEYEEEYEDEYEDEYEEEHEKRRKSPAPPIDLHKLIFRFSNLRKVVIEESLAIFQNFTEETCEIFKNSCPKLETLSVHCKEDEDLPRGYRELLDMLRNMITNIDAENIRDEPSYEKFLTKFPRLKTIEEPPYLKLPIFQEWLPIIVQLPHLTEINMLSSKDDKEDFMEKFLQTKTQKQQDKYIKRLSEISKFEWNCYCNAFNSIKFVSKYMTGLTHLNITTVPFWREDRFDRRRMRSDRLLELSSSIIDYKFKMGVDAELLYSYLPTVFQKVFDEPSSSKKIFQFNIDPMNQRVMDCLVDVFVKTNLHQSVKVVETVHCGGPYVLDRLMGISLEKADEFILKLYKRFYRDCSYVTVDWYEDLFFHIAPFKKLTLDVPVWFEEIETDHSTQEEYPQIQDLTLRATPLVQFQELIDRCHVAFPELTQLSLYYHSGVWNEDVGEFQLDLGEYSLEQLTVDLTPVRSRYTNKKEISDNAFCVVKVSCKSNTEQYFCKVPLCRTKSATLVSSSDLDGQDYLQVHITLMAVDRLKLCIYHDTLTKDNQDYLDESMEYVTCSTLDLK